MYALSLGLLNIINNMGLTSVLWEIFNKPTMGDVLRELMMFIAPLWIAVIVGVLVGWAWKPKWVNLGCRDLVDASLSKVSNSSSIGLASIPSLNFLKFQLPTCISGVSDDGLQTDAFNDQSTINSDCRFVSFYSILLNFMAPFGYIYIFIPNYGPLIW